MFERIRYEGKKIEEIHDLFQRYRYLVSVVDPKITSKDLQSLQRMLTVYQNDSGQEKYVNFSQNLDVLMKRFLLACDVIQAEAEKQFHQGYQEFYVNANQSKAVKHYKNAAHLKHANALNQLGIWYRYGVVVEKNYQQSRQCFELSKSLGFQAAASNLEPVENFSDTPMLLENSMKNSYLYRDKFGNTKAHLAACKGNIEALKQAFHANPDLLNTVNFFFQTPLIVAVLHAQEGVVNYLLSKPDVYLEATTIMMGCPNHPNNGKTALKHAISIAQNIHNQQIKKSILNIAHALISRGARLTPEDLQQINQDILIELLEMFDLSSQVENNNGLPKKY